MLVTTIEYAPSCLNPQFHICICFIQRVYAVKLAIPYFLTNRTWDSLTTATCCKSLVVVYGGNCILQIGVASGSPEDGNAFTVDAKKFVQGSLYTSAMESKKRE